ncbi:MULTISPECIES: hypothetical protein [Actinomadura]|uniref:Secreted protein n=1 Tax=Actinomadura yumaensis TaxID=111807 RepID=A0ABW2CX28_9ACTN|nr:hypothetical protein [Actinomadura sp. J1-007]MWK39489.1 hypothetical protein [Actinomadura sp. J1-007]
MRAPIRLFTGLLAVTAAVGTATAVTAVPAAAATVTTCEKGSGVEFPLGWVDLYGEGCQDRLGDGGSAYILVKNLLWYGQPQGTQWVHCEGRINATTWSRCGMSGPPPAVGD